MSFDYLLICCPKIDLMSNDFEFVIEIVMSCKESTLVIKFLDKLMAAVLESFQRKFLTNCGLTHHWIEFSNCN